MTFLNPKSVALLGASSKTVDEAVDQGSYWGAALKKSLLDTCKVPLYLVGKNDKYLELSEVPDLAIICVPNILEEIINVLEKGTKHIIVINSLEKDVEKQLYELTDNKAKLIGPNCMGIHCDTYSTFLLNKETKGDIGLITQSGGIGEAVCDTVDDVRTVISLGSAEKTTIDDAVEMLKADKNIKRIALYSESYTAKDKNVITMMPKFNRKSIEAVKQHSRQRLWCRTEVINNLKEFKRDTKKEKGEHEKDAIKDDESKIKKLKKGAPSEKKSVEIHDIKKDEKFDKKNKKADASVDYRKFLDPHFTK